MGNIVRLTRHEGRDVALIKEARNVRRDTLTAIQLIASISDRLKEIERITAEIPNLEEREAAEVAVRGLRDTVRSAFQGVSRDF
jgi:hypothetical protein